MTSKPSTIYIVFESDELSPMEILTPILKRLDKRVRTPEFRVLDYTGCTKPEKIILVPKEEKDHIG